MNSKASMIFRLFSMLFGFQESLFAQWVEKSNGLYGGTVNALAADGSNLYAGTDNGIYYSSNGGSNWIPANVGLTNKYVKSLVVKGEYVFAITGNGVCRSADKGVNWSPINGPVNSSISCLAVAGNVLFAGNNTGSGVFLSSDNGETWTAVNNGLPKLSNGSFISINSLTASGTKLFIAANGGIFVTENNGSSWTALNSGLPSNINYNGPVVDAIAVSGTSIYATLPIGIDVNGNPISGGIYYSADSGASWTMRLQRYPLKMAIVGNTVFSADSNVIYTSNDYGLTWIYLSTNFGSFIESFLISDGNLYVGTDGGGVFTSSNNGISWTAINSGLTNAYIQAIVSIGGKWFAGAKNGLFVSSDSGSSWTSISGLAKKNVQALATKGSNIYAGTSTGMFLSTDNGVVWSPIGLYTDIKAITISGGNLFAATQSGGVYLSSNNGSSWITVNNGLTNIYNTTSLVANGNNIYVGTNGGIFLSSNNGADWTPVNNGITDLFIRSLAVNGGDFYAGSFNYNGRIFKSVNGGSNWVELNTKLLYPYSLSFAFSGNSIFAGTGNQGVLLSNDNGANWIQANLGLPINNSPAVVVENGKVIAGTASGVYTRNADDLVKDQMIDFNLTSSLPFSLTPAYLYATSSSGLPVRFTSSNPSVATVSGNNLVFVGVGKTNITASQAGNGSFNPAVDVVKELSVTKGRQTILFNSLPEKSVGDSPFAVSVYTTAGLPVILKSSNKNVAIINQNTITIIGSGATTITASQDGDDNFNTAPIVTQPFIVRGADLINLQPPIVNSFTPTNGPVGATVTIIGDNFGKTVAENVVYFGATRALVTSASQTQLTIKVPKSSTYQNITVHTNGLVAYSSAPFQVTAPNKPITSSFYSDKQDISINGQSGSAIRKVLFTDLDADGKPEMVAAVPGDLGKSRLSILRNTSVATGSITFADFIDFPLANFPTNLVVGDFDGDGKSDLAVTSVTDSLVSIFRNNSSNIGSISFDSRIDFATSESPYDIAAGDLDGDGKVDLATVSYSSHPKVSILKNTNTGPGSVSFAQKIDFFVSSRPYSISIGDLDGDKRPDIVLGSDPNGISILKNSSVNGVIGFEPYSDIPGASDVFSVRIGDLNGDNKPDVALADGDSNSILTYQNVTSADRIISFSKAIGWTTSRSTLDVAIADLDGDGKLDLIGSGSNDNRISVLRNNSTFSTIGFEAKIDFATTLRPRSVAVCDLDGDGRPDIAAGSRNSGVVSILRNNAFAQQSITFNPLISKTYGDLPFQLSATASSSLPITYTSSNLKVATVSGDIVTIVGAGTTTIAAAQEGNGTFGMAQEVSQTLTIAQATPAITWANPSDIIYGTALSATQLNATSNTAGSFTYTPATGTTLNAGSNQNLSVIFTPTDGTNYSTATKQVVINVSKASPSITWAKPSDIVYGTALSATQFNATSNTAGSFTYTPATGTTLNAGSNQNLSVIFTPTDGTNYSTATKQVVINVSKASPSIIWANPSDIIYGTALSATQLNATSATAGTFTFTPAIGTVLNAGSTQILSVTFNPLDVTNYTISSKEVSINVSKANQTITFASIQNKIFPTDKLLTLTVTASSSLPISFTGSTGNVSISPSLEVSILGAGSVTIVANQVGNENYNAATSLSRTFCVNPIKPTVTVSTSNPLATILVSDAGTIGNQWFLNGTAIAGATNQTYTPTQTGNYKVQVTLGGCASEFSTDQSLVVTAIEDATTSIEIYPNPVTGWLTIALGDDGAAKEVKLYSVEGQQLAAQVTTGNSLLFYVAEYSKGLYLAKVQAGEMLSVIKFVKE